MEEKNDLSLTEELQKDEMENMEIVSIFWSLKPNLAKYICSDMRSFCSIYIYLRTSYKNSHLEHNALIRIHT